MPAQRSDRTYLREEEQAILKSLLEEWSNQADKKSKDAFISGTVLPQIQELNLVEFAPEIIERDKAVRVRWEKRVSNHKPFKDRQVFKLERKILLRRVVGKLRAGEIEEIIREKYPDAQKGEKTYPGIYQQALTEYMMQMSSEEEQEMQSILQDWQSEGPPMEVRLRAAKKYGRKAIINAHQLLEKEMYISCIMVSMVPDVDSGAIGVTCHDYIADAHAHKHGKRFKTFSEWCGPKYNLFIQQMIDYANYVKEQKDEGSEQGGGIVSEPVTFEAGPGNLPLLPPPVLGVRSEETAKTAKDIVRAFFLRHYQLAAGNDSVKTPWAQIGEEPSKFFDVDSIPPDFKMSDPSRMGANVKALLSHLRHRQEAHGIQAFQFRQVLRNGVLEPAQYPNEARVALDPAPQVPEPIQQSQESQSPSKSKGRKTKSPTKPKTPRRASPKKSKTIKKEESLTLVEDNIPISAPAKEILGQDMITLEPIPEEADVVPMPSIPTPSLATPAAPQFTSNISTDPPAQYDPILLNDKIPGAQVGPAADLPTQSVTPGWPHMVPFPPPPHVTQFHQSQYPDPRYNIIQQMLSQWAVPPPWNPGPPPPPPQQNPDPSAHGFYQPIPPSAPLLHNFPSSFRHFDPHPIPPGEPPFAPVQLPIPSTFAPIPIQNPVAVLTPQLPKFSPKKRKLDSDGQGSPSKKPTRSSNRTKTPRKEQV